jgi:hypothetical protein
MTKSHPARLPAMSVSFTFAVLLIGSVCALGVLLLLLLIMLMVRSTNVRSGG